MAEGDASNDPTAASDRESASRTFFTTIDATPKPRSKHIDTGRTGAKALKFRTLESTGAGPRITEHHQDLTNLANTLDQRMAALLKEHEKDFFLAYKTHMYTVQKEIKALRMKADHEEAKTREDTKIKALEGQLEWFMMEALRLDELCKGYKKEVDKWKAKAEALDEDRRFLEDQIKGAKRQNKILRAAAERARSSAYSALMATKARAEGGGGYPDGGAPLALTAPPGNDRASARQPRPSSASAADPGARAAAAAGPGARKSHEVRSRTPEARQALAALPASPSANSLAPLGGRGSMPAVASTAHLTSTSTLSTIGGGIGKNVLGNDTEERYVEAIQHLKESIAREQHSVRMLQAARATQYSKKSEMEEFFLKCIDEARKELTRKRHLTMYKEKPERERVLEAMLNNEDVLVCLYEKLFPHRTGIARSLGGPASGEEMPRPQQLPLDDIGSSGPPRGR